MDPRRLKPEKMTVKAVGEFIHGYHLDIIHGLQQILLWFGQAPKLERILWAYLKKEHIRSTKIAEAMAVEYRRKEYHGFDSETPLPVPSEELYTPDLQTVATEKETGELEYEIVQRPLKQVVDICPKCGKKMVGEPVPHCETVKTKRVFYKECASCTYYVEIYKLRSKYIAREGGD